MNKYRVYGHTTVTVIIDVKADSETKAYETAIDELCGLTAYCGNGGIYKLVGVDGDEQSVKADEEIEYDDIELLGSADNDDDDEDEDGEEDDDE